MKVISVIEVEPAEREVIKKILKHLGFWDRKARLLPKAKSLSAVLVTAIEVNAVILQSSHFQSYAP